MATTQYTDRKYSMCLFTLVVSASHQEGGPHPKNTINNVQTPLYYTLLHSIHILESKNGDMCEWSTYC